MKTSARTLRGLWVDLREDRSAPTTRIIEHLVLGGSPEDAVESIAKAGIDLNGYDIVRQAREYLSIMSEIDEPLLTPEDWDLVDTIITKLRSEGNEDANELLRAVKVDLRVIGLDDHLRERIDLQLAKFSLPEAWRKEWTSTIGRRTAFAIEKQDGDRLIARVSRDTRLDARVAWYSTTKGYGVGVVNGIVEEGAIHNRVHILPTAVMSEQGIVTSGFGSVSLKVKNCPVIPLSEAAYDRLYGALVPPAATLYIGIAASNGRPLFRGTKAMLQEQSVGQTLSDLESRIPVIGLPGSAKTTGTNQVLRQVAKKTDLGIVAISPSAPNLAGYGGAAEVIPNQAWNFQKVAESYIEQTGGDPLPDYRLLTLSEKSIMPSLDDLHQQTLMELLAVISRSPQIRAIWASRFADSSPAEVLERAAAGQLFNAADGFEPQQARTAQRYAAILRAMFGSAKQTVNLGELVDRETMPNRHLGIYIPADSTFVCELTFIALSEVFYRGKNTYNPKTDGIVVALDEIPFLYESTGAVIPGSEAVNLFGKMTLQGRNRGILLAGLMQDEKYLSRAFPGNADNYPRYTCAKHGEARLLSTPRSRVWIPPVSYRPANA